MVDETGGGDVGTGAEDGGTDRGKWGTGTRDVFPVIFLRALIHRLLIFLYLGRRFFDEFALPVEGFFPLILPSKPSLSATAVVDGSSRWFDILSERTIGT